jgi:hypothetical protein
VSESAPVGVESAEIGRRARLIRRRRGLSLDVVAGFAGISKGYLSMLDWLAGVGSGRAADGTACDRSHRRPGCPACGVSRAGRSLSGRWDAAFDRRTAPRSTESGRCCRRSPQPGRRVGPPYRRGQRIVAALWPCQRCHLGVNVAVELQRGPEVAARANSQVPRLLSTLGSPVRGGALYFDLARACAQAQGARDGEAIGYLDAADRLAPQYVRPDPMARELVAELDRRARRRIWELDSLRNRFGIGELSTRRMQK